MGPGAKLIILFARLNSHKTGLFFVHKQRNRAFRKAIKNIVEFAGAGLGMLSEAGGFCAAQLSLGQSTFSDLIMFVAKRDREEEFRCCCISRKYISSVKNEILVFE